MNSTEEMASQPETNITCDYLIVGAGTGCLSFVDTLLTLREDVTFVIVDRNSRPGGHWTSAYPFVLLHQPSCYYGVKSLSLGKLDKNGKEIYNLNDRATADEICVYYRKVVENFVATGRVRTYFEANYEGEAAGLNETNSSTYNDPTAKITHIFTTKEGRSIHVKCMKVVQSETKAIVPSMRKGVPFPIDEKVVKAIPLNHLPKHIGKTRQKYMVIGAGKSGVDAINYLLDHGNVDPDQIIWIVSQSNWYWLRDGISPHPAPGSGFWKRVNKTFFEPLVKGKSADEVFLLMEKVGAMGRVDPDDGHFPRVFKGASISNHDLANLRRLKNVVKNRGRVTSITSREVIIQNGAHTIPFSPSDTVIVDCMADDNLFGYFDFDENFELFNPHKIRLGPTTSLYNPSHSSSQAAFLEANFDDSEAGDAVKNSFCFYPRGPRQLKETTHQQIYLLIAYSDMKTNEQFSHYGPYSRYVMGDRTDMINANHHGGFLGLLWHLFGPTQIKKKADTFVEKMENGGFEDFPTKPMPHRGVEPKKFQAVRRKSTKRRSSKSMSKAKASSMSATTPGEKKNSGIIYRNFGFDSIKEKMHRFFL